MRGATDQARIMAIFRDGSPDERAAFVNACPPHPFRDGAATLSQSDDLARRVMAMGLLTTAYCHGARCALGAEIALAGHALGCEALRAGAADLQPGTLSCMATGAVEALRELGRTRQAADLCDRLLAYHQALDPIDRNLHALRLWKVELLLELGRLEEAEAAFRTAPAPAGANAAASRLLRLRLDEARRRASGGPELPGAAKTAPVELLARHEEPPRAE